MGIIKKLPRNERPREKAILYGIEHLSNAELLAVILSTGSRQLDALELAIDLLKETGTLSNLEKWSYEELSKINGIKSAKAIKIKASLELNHRIQKEMYNEIQQINNIKDAANFIRIHFGDLSIEKLGLLILNQKNEFVFFRILSVGTQRNVIISPSIIFQEVFSHRGTRIIIAHNHPSFNAEPSDSDIEQTNTIKLASSMLGIEFIDHLILTRNGFYSIEQLKYEKFDA